MMPKHSSRAPWGRRLTALTAVSLLTVAACSDSGGGGVGPSAIEVVEIVTLPNNQSLTNLAPGTTRQMLGAPTNSKGNWVDRPVTWASSNNAVATVDANGLVTTQLGGGTTYIRATAGGQTDSVRVDVRYPVGEIIFAETAVELRREGVTTLTTEVRDTQNDVVTDRTLTWSSSNTAVATVAAGGVISATEDAIDGSTATITATAANASDGGTIVTESIVVTVNGDAVVASVEVSGGSGFRGATGTVQLSAEALSGLDNTIVWPITWSTSDAAVATVDAAGLVTFVGGAGAVTITATAEDAGLDDADISGTTSFDVALVLSDASPRNIPSLAADADQYYAYLMTATTDSTIFEMSGGTGDADLYLYRPGSSAINFSSFNSGNGETIAISPASVGSGTSTAFAGWWRVRINYWIASEGATVTTTTYDP